MAGMADCAKGEALNVLRELPCMLCIFLNSQKPNVIVSPT